MLIEIDAVADRFEAEWAASHRPLIEDWICQFDSSLQPQLLAELIAIELEWRSNCGEAPLPEEYRNRFPDQVAIVEQAFTSRLQSNSLEMTGEYQPDVADTFVPTSGLSPAESLSSGKLFLDRFQLQRKLGQGGFGSVYEATDLQLGRSVALKVPHPGASDETHQRFLAEARAAGKLRHQHIVTVFDGGDSDGTLYIVCELIEGQDLAQTVKSAAPSLKQLVSWIHDAALGLAYAHREGVIHRDIKPANLLIAADGRILVADFGLARRHDDDSALTVDGSVFGTPAYMSPEQAMGNTAAVGPASDQYSLGVVLYEILTGRVPFPGKNIQQVLYQIQNLEAPAPRSLHAAVPADLEAICQKSMSREPGERYPDLEAFAADLQRWLNHEPVLARPVSSVERLRRRMKRHPLISALTAATIILLILSGITGALSWDRGRQIGQIQSQSESQRTAQEQKLEQSRQKVSLIQNEVIEKNNAVDQNRYRILMRQISEDLQRGRMQPDRLRSLLNDCPPQLREWEWYYFQRLLHPQSQTLFSSQTPLRDAAFSPDETQLAVIDSQGTVSILSTSQGQLTHQWQSKAIDVQQIAWNPAGTQLAIGDKLNSLKIWDVKSGKLIASLGNQDFLFGAKPANGEYISPGVSELIESHLNRSRPKATKQNPRKLTPPTPGNLPFGGFAGNAPLAGFPAALHSLEGYGWAVAFDSTGKRIAVGGDRFVQIWDLAEQRRTHLLLVTKHTYVTSLSFSPDDRRLSAGTFHGELVVFDSEEGTELLRIMMNVPHSHYTTAWNPDSESLYVPDSDGEVGVLGISDQLLRTPTERHRGKINSIRLSTDGALLATAGTDSTIRIWHANALQLAKLILMNSTEIRRLQFFADHHRLLACTPGDVQVWNIDSLTPPLRNRRIYPENEEQSPDPEIIAEVSIDETVTRVSLSPDQQFSTVVLNENRLSVRKMSTGEQVLAFPDQTMIRAGTRISGAPRFDPQGRWLAVAAHGTEEVPDEKKPLRRGFANPRVAENAPVKKTYDLMIWTLPDWKAQTIRLSEQPYISYDPGFIDASSDGRLLAYCRSRELFLLDTGNYQVIRSLKTSSPIRCLDFSPSSQSLALKCANGQIQLINASTGAIERHFGRQGGPEPDRLIPVKSTLDLEFSPDGSLLASGDREGTITLWNVETGAVQSRLTGHTGNIDALTFHPGGRRLVSSSSDHTIRIWDVINGEEIGLLSDLDRNYYLSGGLTFSKNGRELYAAENGLFLRFDAGPELLTR
ncbi:MAG: protein kinase [Planctomycetaceae bacterium]|nr:protein kinase [Planctomycetaceae bacterium]